MYEEDRPTFSEEDIIFYTKPLEYVLSSIRVDELEQDLKVAERLRLFLPLGGSLASACAIEMDTKLLFVSEWLLGQNVNQSSDEDEVDKALIGKLLSDEGMTLLARSTEDEKLVTALKDGFAGSHLFATLMTLAATEEEKVAQAGTRLTTNQMGRVTDLLTDQTDYFMFLIELARVLRPRYQADESGGPLIRSLSHIADSPKDPLHLSSVEPPNFMRLGFKESITTYMAVYSIGKYHDLPGPQPSWKKS